jgi:hypothetical protein
VTSSAAAPVSTTPCARSVRNGVMRRMDALSLGCASLSVSACVCLGGCVVRMPAAAAAAGAHRHTSSGSACVCVLAGSPPPPHLARLQLQLREAVPMPDDGTLLL